MWCNSTVFMSTYLPVKLDRDTFCMLKAMAKADCRSVSQQIRFLMLVGKDFIANSNGVLTRHTDNGDTTELESAIGFKVGE